VIYTESARRSTSRRIQVCRIRIAAVVIVLSASAAALDHRWPVSSRSTAAPPTSLLRGAHQRGPLGAADGAVPDGTTVFEDGVPGVAKLDPALVGALRRAATQAADTGAVLFVDSGWRSPAYQEQLVHGAISKYGSREEAAHWVAAPDRSAHVAGEAVDIGPSDSAAWLSAHGAEYGLCRIYANEPWHYELRAEAIGQGCPATYADPTHDPRMQR